MAAAAKNTEIYDEVRSDFDPMFLVFLKEEKKS